MILQAGLSSSGHNAAAGEMAGSPVQYDASGLLRPVPQAIGIDERAAAAERMRHQLYMMDRSQRRPTIEECVAAILERSSLDLPA